MKVTVSPGRAFVTTADACYTRQHLERELLPGAVWDADSMLDSLRRLRAMGERTDTELLFGHDTAQWERLPQAGRELT